MGEIGAAATVLSLACNSNNDFVRCHFVALADI